MSVDNNGEREQARLQIQGQLDARKTQAERNRLGQFATPTVLAQDIIRETLRLRSSSSPIRFLDPAFGTGSFYSALVSLVGAEHIGAARGYEIDEHYGKPALGLWGGTPLDLRIADFTEQPLPVSDDSRFNVIVCNPPYVRHHHIVNNAKKRLGVLAKHASNVELSGLAGLYCYFLTLSHAWMTEDGIAAWLIPSEFMDVNYGQEVKQYLMEQVTLLSLHRFDPADVQFGDALVSSAVLWFRKSKPPASQSVQFSFGGSIDRPKLVRAIPASGLVDERKWTRFPADGVRGRSLGSRLADLFTIKRGLATGSNSFFILSERDIEARGLPWEYFKPILPSPRHLETDEILADERGWPKLNRRLFLLDCRLSEGELKVQEPLLWRYLESGREAVAGQYLCRNRKVWYFQEERPSAPLLVTYIGRAGGKRGRPFRFILNHSSATAANVYLMLYPKQPYALPLARSPELLRSLWNALNRLPTSALVGEGRVYGGGMHKMEPRELGNVDASSLLSLFQQTELSPSTGQLSLWDEAVRQIVNGGIC